MTVRAVGTQLPADLCPPWTLGFPAIPLVWICTASAGHLVRMVCALRELEDVLEVAAQKDFLERILNADIY